MNLFIVDLDIHKSARMLDSKRLFSSLYESCHGLASLLNIELVSGKGKIIKPKRSRANHACALQYKDYEAYWLDCLWIYYIHWFTNHSRPETQYKETAIYRHLHTLSMMIGDRDIIEPKFMNSRLVQIHRSILLKKDTKLYSQFKWKNIDSRITDMLYFDKETEKFDLPKSKRKLN